MSFQDKLQLRSTLVAPVRHCLPPHWGATRREQLHHRGGVVPSGIFCRVKLHFGTVGERLSQVFTRLGTRGSTATGVVPVVLRRWVTMTAGLKRVRVFMIDSICSQESNQLLFYTFTLVQLPNKTVPVHFLILLSDYQGRRGVWWFFRGLLSHWLQSWGGLFDCERTVCHISHLAWFGSPGSGFCVLACGDKHSRHQNHQLLLLLVALDQPDEHRKKYSIIHNFFGFIGL